MSMDGASAAPRLLRLQARWRLLSPPSLPSTSRDHTLRRVSAPVLSAKPRGGSCSVTGVIVERSAETGPAFDRTDRCGVVARRHNRADDPTSDPLVVALGHGMNHELADQVPQVTLAEDDERIQAFGPNRFHEALRMWIAVWTLRWESGRTSRASAAPLPSRKRTRSSRPCASCLRSRTERSTPPRLGGGCRCCLSRAWPIAPSWCCASRGRDPWVSAHPLATARERVRCTSWHRSPPASTKTPQTKRTTRPRSRR